MTYLRMLRQLTLPLVLAVSLASRARAQTTETVPPERLDARQWFRDAKFGLFIHWGVYSQLAQGEWVMHNRGISVESYEWLASAFNPVKFDAREWVALAKAAGVRYITITSRHHDGFSMFASRVTRYNIVDHTPFARDPMRELADECRRQGIRLFFYYSQLDWRHPDYWPRGETGRTTGRPDAGEWRRYLDFMDQQLIELLTNYGSLGGIWFDGMWDKPDADWRLAQTYALIHRLQPEALIVPNHHKAPLPGEDVQTFEQDLPGANTAGFNTKEIGALPLETSLTMNQSWGFNITDRRFKSHRELVGYLVRAAGADANLLLNVGPRPDGTIQPEAVERLRALGDWLRTYGASVFGTRGGPLTPRPWGVTTRRGDSVFVHVLDWADPVLALPDFGSRVMRASMLKDGKPVEFTQTARGITLALPPAARDEADRVIVLETRRQGRLGNDPGTARQHSVGHENALTALLRIDRETRSRGIS
jgi:alpha-L-fucosidase